MSGMISAGGLITGLNSNELITQLLQLERQPLIRAQNRITNLEAQRESVRNLRSQLQTLRNQVQDFRLNNIFQSYSATSSETTVLASEISSSNPVSGAFEVNVTKLASATVAGSSAVMGASINSAATLNSSGITSSIEAGTFTVNGVQFTVDPATDSLDDILADISASSAGVTATYDAGTDKVVFENSTLGDTSQINFGASGDTSNFLTAIAVTQATQFTNGDGSTELTSTRHLGTVDATAVINTVSFADGAITAGSFSINGISITVDPTTDTILDVVERINGSDAQVTASFDSAADTIRVTATGLGSRNIRFGGTGDTSNFLAVTNLDNATQTAGNDAQFTINGGAAQTRNTNDVSDAISGVTIRLLSTGTSTVRVAHDDDTIVEDVREFVNAFNTTVQQIRQVTGTGGRLAGDTGIRAIEDFLRQNIFSQVNNLNGEYDSLLNIGIDTGDDFDSSAVSLLQFDEEAFRSALLEDRYNVEQLFSNNDNTGIGDLLYGYLNDITSTTGFLNNRAKAGGTLDTQIDSVTDSIARIEDRLAQKEARLRRQFSNLESLSAGLQQQNNALSALRSIF